MHTEYLVALDRTDAGVPLGGALDGALATRLAWAYDASLAGVRVHTDAIADALNRSAGTLALTWRHHVFLSQRVQHASGDVQRVVLAHELAHVAQKRQGG